MKQPSRTVPRRRQSVSPTPRHLPLVDILIATQAELQALVVASGLKVLAAMLEEDRAAGCGPRYAHQPARQAYRTGHTPSQVVLGGRKVAMRRPRARRAGEEVPLPTARAFANADPLNRRVVDQMLIGVATRQHPHKNGPRRGAPGPVDWRDWSACWVARVDRASQASAERGGGGPDCSRARRPAGGRPSQPRMIARSAKGNDSITGISRNGHGRGDRQSSATGGDGLYPWDLLAS